jgi:hypothetical protein
MFCISETTYITTLRLVPEKPRILQPYVWYQKNDLHYDIMCGTSKPRILQPGTNPIFFYFICLNIRGFISTKHNIIISVYDVAVIYVVLLVPNIIL